MGQVYQSVKTGREISGITKRRIICIKSFNVTTREIVFVNLYIDDIHELRTGFSSKISFYIGERLLFEPLVVHPYDSRTYNDLVFTYYDNKFYLPDGYGGQSEENLQIREANAQKRQAEWDILST